MHGANVIWYGNNNSNNQFILLYGNDSFILRDILITEQFEIDSEGNYYYKTRGWWPQQIYYKEIPGMLGSGSSSSSSGSSIDYSTILNTIHTDLGNLNISIADSTTTINGSLQQILTTLQSNSNTQVVNAINNTSTQTQNVISQSSAQTQNLINNQTAQSSAQYSEFTNTVDYNQSDVQIDSSGFEFQDVNGVDSFLNTFYTLFQNFFDTLQTDINVVVQVPIPFTDKSFDLDTAPIQRFYANYPVLSNIITALWWVILGRYIIGLSVTIFNWCSNGMVLKDTDKIAKELNDRNVIIKDLMM